MTTKDQVRLLRKQGKTYEQIATQLGIARVTVYYHISDKAKQKINTDNMNRRLAFIRQIKAEAGGKCIKCGYHKYLDALEFHHRDPRVKVDGLASLAQHAGKAKIRKEAAKCDLLCPNCHREFHIEERIKLRDCTQDTVKPVS